MNPTSIFFWSTLAVCATIVCSATPQAHAHGIWGHIHVTGWAIENLPDGELQTFFQDPEVFNAALFGAAFVDSGYWPQGGDFGHKARAYSEHTHWEPFIEDFVTWIRANDPPPWTSHESKKRVAFLFGCASHGLQDEVFDSLFLDHLDTHDHAGQSEADPATDGFLALDGHLRFIPKTYIPIETLLELYTTLPEDITRDVIEDSVGVMTLIYVNDNVGIDTAYDLGEQYRDTLPWARTNYLNPDIPGSLHAEVEPTARYIQALWDRLHGRNTANSVIFAYPNPPRRLLHHAADHPGSTATLIFGAGTHYPSIAPSLQNDTTQTNAELRTRNTRWNETWTRLVRIQPTQDLTPGAFYTLTQPGGVELINGSTLAPFATTFQVTCTPPDDPACPPTPDPNDPILTPPTSDAGPDTADASTDSTPDTTDTSPNPQDTDSEDIAPDTPQDISDPSPVPPSPAKEQDSCACATTHHPPPTSGWFLLCAFGVFAVRKRLQRVSEA